MDIVFVAGVATIAADPPSALDFYRGTIGLPLETVIGDYAAVDGFGGVKHLGVWPLADAARSCFGSPEWPNGVPVPQATIEFEVADVDAVRAAADELLDAGHELIHHVRTEPWGQTLARLLGPEGLLIGISHTPWLHEPQDGATADHATTPGAASPTAESGVPAPPALEFVASVEVDLGEPVELGDVPLGRRRIIPIVGGTIRGPALEARIVDGGADWQLVDADGTAVIDTRYHAETASGDHLFLATQGFRHAPPDVLDRLAAGDDVDDDEYYFRLTVRLESGASELDWVNRTVFVADASRRATAVGYDLFAVR